MAFVLGLLAGWAIVAILGVIFYKCYIEKISKDLVEKGETEFTIKMFGEEVRMGTTARDMTTYED